jgi:flagellar motility protein MotE (MotC chaperone)
LNYHTLTSLRRRHPAWRLLAAERAPFIMAFLFDAFTKPNRRTLAESELTAWLDDFLFDVHTQLGEAVFPGSATYYLNDWTNDAQGWLRKFYPDDGDEPHFDLTPATEKAIEWLATLEQKQFVGTESRLKTIFDLLHQMARGTETDPMARIAELEKRRAGIDEEIARVRSGDLNLMDATQIKERFHQVEQIARALLSDFRQVEQNFRDLDRRVREKIALWEGGKGELLANIFGESDVIADSDQGKSFRAFWDFLMSPSRQDEFTTLLERILALGPVAETSPDARLRRVHYDWLEAGEAAQRTVARLSGQLRKYLDDQAWLENRRIMHIIRDIEQQALAVRKAPPEGDFATLSDSAPSIALTMDRPLFAPPVKARIAQQSIEEGGAGVDAEALFEQVYVDKAVLDARIRRALQTRDQVALTTLLAEHPLEQGLAELVAYMSLAADNGKALIDESRMETVTWTDQRGDGRQATLPTVIFSR